MSAGLCQLDPGPATSFLVGQGSMDSLLGALGGSFPTRTGSSASGFFRSCSTLGNTSTHDSEEQWSDDGSSLGSASRRITLAKRVLAEATHTFTPCLSINAAKSDKCRNTGALGPLLCMIQSERGVEALHRSLDTLSFLLLDKANRKLVAELGGLHMLLGLFMSETDPTLLRMALDCICSLAKVDDREKDHVWAHPAKQAILALLNPRAGVHHLLEVLLLIRKLAFRGTPGAAELIDPQVLLAASELLAHAPNMAPAVSLKVCKLLRACAECAGHDHIAAWHAVLSQLVPLLAYHSVSEGVLDVLSSLAEHMAFKNMFVVVNGLPSLLPLIVSPMRTIATKAAALVACLSEGGLSQQQLCSDGCTTVLLRAVTLTAPHADTTCALVYALTNLAKLSPKVVVNLQEQDAVSMIQSMRPGWSDPELLLGVQQFLQTIQRPAESTAADTSCQAAGTPISMDVPSACGFHKHSDSACQQQDGKLVRTSSAAARSMSTDSSASVTRCSTAFAAPELQQRTAQPHAHSRSGDELQHELSFAPMPSLALVDDMMAVLAHQSSSRQECSEQGSSNGECMLHQSISCVTDVSRASPAPVVSVPALSTGLPTQPNTSVLPPVELCEQLASPR